ncbi:MAG: chemotaxis protein CheB [Calditrichaceae bacterium]|nr:chemotaxis protein CheB [Calditrichaceae bacterium]
MNYEAVVIGASAGGLGALQVLFSNIGNKFKLPVLIVQHLHPESEDYLSQLLKSYSHLRFKEADDKEPIRPGTVYYAPANYHLLVSNDKSMVLNVDEKVNYCRPSVDVLFESAADVYGPHLIGIVLTGSNQDGAAGMAMIKRKGGLTIVQDPKEAEVDAMPRAAIEKVKIDHILSLEKIGKLLTKFY